MSIGRGAFYNPWIFQHTLHYLKLGRSRREEALLNPDKVALIKNESPYVASYGKDNELLPEPTFAERVHVMCRHLDLMIEVFGEEQGCRMFRKIAPWHAKRFGPCREFNKRVVKISTKAEFDDVLENYIRWRQQFLDENGELQPRFRPPPMVASFMRETTSTTEQIPVPK